MSLKKNILSVYLQHRKFKSGLIAPLMRYFILIMILAGFPVSARSGVYSFEAPIKPCFFYFKKMITEKKKQYLRAYREKNKEILKEKHKIYRERNKKLLKERAIKYRESNPEKVKESRLKFKNANRDKIRKEDKIYRDTHKDKRNNYNREYYSENKDYFAEYYKYWILNLSIEEKTKLKYQLRNGFHRGRAKQKNSDVSSDFLRKLYEGTTKCPLCGVVLVEGNEKANAKNLDHIIPLKVGGKHIKSNIRIICKKCNQSRPKDGSDLKT